MAGKIIICRGYPASGKTTWAEEQVSAHESTVHVSRDDIRFNYLKLDRGVGTQEQENIVTRVQHLIVSELIGRGYTVILDDTNLPLKRAREWAQTAVSWGAEWEVKDFPVDAATCVQRDTDRYLDGGRYVGEDVIRGMAARFQFPLPEVVLTDPAAPVKYEPNVYLPPAWIVDLDGTLALHTSGRSPYDFTRVSEDSVNIPVENLIHGLAGEGHQIIFLSGRDDSCYQDTFNWITGAKVPGYGQEIILFMRKTGDQRKDALIKSEIFWDEIAPKWHVIGVLDDRQQVIDMWRGLGLFAAQVDYGNF